MLRQRLSASLTTYTRKRLRVFAAHRRFHTTLGGIEAFFTTLREKEQLTGGTVQLCITEDLHLFAEYRRSYFGEEQRRIIPLNKEQHRHATDTVQEALRFLESPVPTTPAVHAASASSSLCISSTHSRPPFPPNATVVDLSRVTVDEVRRLLRHVESAYPALKVIVHHTSGHDLQGTKLHTISVELLPRTGGAGVAPLPEDVQRLVDAFKGESVGEGYNGCLRRALRDAFAAAQLPYPTLPDEEAMSSTLLSLYAQVWVNDGFQLFMASSSLLSPTAESVECSVRHPTHGQVLGTTTLPLTAVGLRDLLTFCDQVTASYKPEQYTSVQQRIQSAPLHLVLPTSHLRVKHLLLKLLYYHYGCADSDVIFTTHLKSAGVFAAEIAVRLPSSSVTYSNTTQPPLFALAKTTGTARKVVLELAAVQAMQTLFPEVFHKQIAYHSRIQEILQSDKASALVNMAPQVARGLEVQLKWALQTMNVDFVVESVLLKPNTPYPLWGVATRSSSAWLAQLFLLRPSASSFTGDASAPPVVRELGAHAFDTRKSRSEQKAMAAVLAKYFPDVCHASIRYAQEKGLIDSNGAPMPIVGVQPIQGPGSEYFAAALSSDRSLATVVPILSSVLQPLPECDVRHSALEVFWTVMVNHATEPLTVRVVRGGESGAVGGSAGGRYTAKCLEGRVEGPDEIMRVVCEATESTEIGALLALLEATQKALHQADSMTGTSDKEIKQLTNDAGRANAASKSTMEFLVGVPTSLPPSTPLQTCVDAIGRLYGLRCAVRVTQDGVQYTSELWGNLPVDSTILKPNDKICSSPFFLDRKFLLGRGHAESPSMAVVRAAQNVFESHIRVHQRAFHNTVVQEGTLHLRVDESGHLARLMDTVVSEIKAASDKVLTDSTLLLHFYHGQLYELTFSVVSNQQSIKLEETVSQYFLDCFHKLCTRVSTEMGGEFFSAAKLAPIVFHTPEQLLRLLCRLAYGFHLCVEVQLVHKMWHCRLSIPVTVELACCVAESTASRKKEAVDVAAMNALKRYFADEVPQIPSYAIFSSCRSGETDADSVHTSMENYVFQRSDVAENVPPPS